ncbi:MAG: GGDEF domain-containing protein [Pirellulaceae bacterium]
MPILEFSLPAALAVVATLGYIVGRQQVARKVMVAERPNRFELKRAKAIIRDLECVSQQVRGSLAEHHASLVAFKNRVTELSKASDPTACQDLAGEAERVLKPTLMLSKQISLAYEEIRQQTGMLLTFTELRTDPLTGLNNRRALDETLAARFALFTRYHTMFSVVILDVDRFKQLNDQHGHLRGDEILQQVAQAILQSARETDIVTRYGGEEFVVVCPETDLAGGCVLAERVRLLVEKQLETTISAGVAMAVTGDTARSLLARADSALYSAKAGGRNRVYQHSGHHILPYNHRAERTALPATLRLAKTPDDEHEVDGEAAASSDSPNESSRQNGPAQQDQHATTPSPLAATP